MTTKELEKVVNDSFQKIVAIVEKEEKESIKKWGKRTGEDKTRAKNNVKKLIEDWKKGLAD